MSDVKQEGLIVYGVFPGGRAAAAGVQKGDRIIAVNDRPITCAQDWIDSVNDSASRKISLIRGNTFLELQFDMSIPGIDPSQLTPDLIQEMMPKR